MKNNVKSAKSSDTDELKNILQSGAIVILTRDYIINMDDWTPFTPKFSKLFGYGCSITLDYSHTFVSNRKMSLFAGLSNKEIHDLNIKVSYTTFESGSLFGPVTNCYFYHIVLYLSGGSIFNNWKGDFGLISTVITSSVMLHVGIISSNAYFSGIEIINTNSNSYSSNVGLIAGKVTGICEFAGIYVSGKVEVQSSYTNDNFGVLFGMIASGATVGITASLIDIYYLQITSKHRNYEVGMIIGENNGDVEINKFLLSVTSSTDQITGVGCSLVFGSLIGYNSRKVTIRNSFVQNSFNVIEVYSSGTLYSGGLIGKSQSSTISVTNTSVDIIFTLQAIPYSSYGGYFIGYSYNDKINLYNNYFYVSFSTWNYPFEYHDIGNDNYFTASIQNTYYAYGRLTTHTITLRNQNFQYQAKPLSYLDDFLYDESSKLYYYSKMAHISSNSIIDGNSDFKKVDIKFNGYTPYFSSDNKDVYIYDNIPFAISSFTSSDYYIVIMPKIYNLFPSVDFAEEYTCVSSNDLPSSIDTSTDSIALKKLSFEFSCKSTINFELKIKFDSKYDYYYKRVVWKSNGSGGGEGGDGGDGDGGDDEYDPRDSLEILITKILIGVNAGVAGLIVLISICCYFTCRN